ncbi:DUF7283 family protein [Halomicrobium salinisoli]|uniref:DUF7283 family protein n=1 Tax=Halomicrobium salinisoli TaxID=2878391 RepID=UPI001CF023D7|nr:hypothetical protein [Halomicrobium salinisoli]
MFDVPVDAWYVWLGVAAASLTALGTVGALPSGTPPDAAATADAIDRVAAGPPGSSGVRAVDAREWRIGPQQVQLRDDDGRAAAAFAYGPVTPVRSDDRLAAVLAGEGPAEVFESRAAFGDATRTARDAEPDWRPAPDRVSIRRVSWGETDVTLVG